jgi:hypothetical protein
MIRTISLAVLAAVALSGCVSSGYAYRDGGVGDYYYGRSSQSYYRGGVPYGSVPYGSVPYGSVGYGYPGGVYGSIRYGYPSYYGGGYYGRPGYGYYGPYYPPYYRPYVRPHHPHHPHRHGGKRPHHGKPPPDERPNPGHAGRPGPGNDDRPWRNPNRIHDGRPGDPRAVPLGPDRLVRRPGTTVMRGVNPPVAPPSAGPPAPRIEPRPAQVQERRTTQPRSSTRRTGAADSEIP